MATKAAPLPLSERCGAYGLLRANPIRGLRASGLGLGEAMMDGVIPIGGLEGYEVRVLWGKFQMRSTYIIFS